MAVTRGMFVAYLDPQGGKSSTQIPFQYNPAEVTRVLRLEKDEQRATGSALNVRDQAIEEYTLTLELDATDGLEKEAPLTSEYGISPRLAALELLMQPLGTSVLGSLAGGSGNPATRKLPLVLLVWGPRRIAPVVLTALTIHETGFDELLNPIHASADLGFRILRASDVPSDDDRAKAAADYYQGARAERASLQVGQQSELGS